MNQSQPGAGCAVCVAGRIQPEVSPNPFYRLVRCTACGHVTVADGGLTKANVGIQLSHFDETFATRSGFFVALYERINCQRAFRLLAANHGGRLLEVGPGSGSLMAYFARRGWDVIGLDLSASVARNIRERYGLPMLTKTLEEHREKEAGEQYDAIVMRHVVEHFSNPVDALQCAEALLRPGGMLYVAVPNMDSWHRHFSGWSGYEPYHMQYFGASSMSHALERAGLTVVHIGSYESLSGWSNTLLRSLKPGGRGAAGAGIKSADEKKQPVRKLLEIVRLTAGVLISPLRWIQAAIGRGEELYVVAAKARP